MVLNGHMVLSTRTALGFGREVHCSGFALALELFSICPTGSAEMAGNFGVRPRHRYLVIGETDGLAVPLGNWSGVTQVLAGHSREQVVLDLIVQAAVDAGSQGG